MTDIHGTLNEYLRKTGARLDGDFLTEGMRLLAQLMMDLEVTERIGAFSALRTVAALALVRAGPSALPCATVPCVSARVARQRCPTLCAGKREYIIGDACKTIISTHDPDNIVTNPWKHMGIYTTS